MLQVHNSLFQSFSLHLVRLINCRGIFYFHRNIMAYYLVSSEPAWRNIVRFVVSRKLKWLDILRLTKSCGICSFSVALILFYIAGRWIIAVATFSVALINLNILFIWCGFVLGLCERVTNAKNVFDCCFGPEQLLLSLFLFHGSETFDRSI